MTTIGILGTGRVGRALGDGLLKAGHQVTFGARSPATVQDRAVPVAGLRDAAADSEVVINALPGSAALDALTAVGSSALAGKILIDVANALNDRFELLFPNASLGAAIQDAFPGSAVVKTLNTVTATLMANPGTLPPTNVFLSGNDEAAKTVVGGLLQDLGWDPAARIDLGDISTARAPEHYIFLSMALMRVLGTTSYGIGVQRR